MGIRAVFGFALAPAMLLPGCGVVATVLSSVDSGTTEEAGASAVPDGTLGSDDAEVIEDGGAEQEADAVTAPDAAVDVLDANAQPTTHDASDGGDGPSCGVCTGGMTCQGGHCACPPGLFFCGNTCVDEQTDNENCGACSVVCSAGLSTDAGMCTAGRCLVTLAVIGSQPPGAIALDTDNVYWTSSAGGRPSPVLMKVPKAGGAATTLYISDAGIGPAGAYAGTAPSGLAVAATELYWTESNVGPPDSGPPTNLMTMSTAGGSATPLVSGLDDPCLPVVDATSIYWMDGCSSNGPVSNGTVMKAPIDGGPVSTLASGQSMSGYSIGFAVDAMSVYWTTSDSVMKGSIAGGSVTTLASAQNFQYGSWLAVDAANVYWTTSDSIVKISIADGAATTLASGQNYPRGIAVDESSIYWASGDGTVMKMSTAGGTPTLLASQQLYYTGGYLVSADQMSLAVDATSVYWIEALPSFNTVGATAVMKLTPK